MSNLYIERFVNERRPQLEHLAVTVIPIDILGPEIAHELEESLKVSSSDGVACAASARLWEILLEKYRVPYLLLRVADVRSNLGSSVTSLPLYEELQSVLQDPQFGRWVAEYKSSTLLEAELQLKAFKTLVSFTPSQRWRSTAKMDGVFPYCQLQQAEIRFMREQWTTLSASESLMTKYLNIHCLETNIIEGTVLFNTSATAKLIQVGFYTQAMPISEKAIIGGAVRDRRDALPILKDTLQAVHEVFALLKNTPLNLTMETIYGLHKTLMRTSQVLDAETGHGKRLCYCNIGTSRQTSKANVTATLKPPPQEVGSPVVKIQFCPYDEVDSELTVFCERFNKLMQQSDVDPFAAAAWISHVFVTIHPFEDGNGRLSRMLASIPLLKAGLPPLCIPASYKDAYIKHLNAVRANRDGDYQMLMLTLFKATRNIFEILELLES